MLQTSPMHIDFIGERNVDCSKWTIIVRSLYLTVVYNRDNMATTKLSIRVAVDQEQLDWIDKKVEEGIYASRSHAYRYAVTQLMKLDRMRHGEI